MPPSPHGAFGSKRLLLFLAAGFLIPAVFLFYLHYRLAVVVGKSMAPNFATGDLLLVDKQAYQHALPQRGDLVLCRYRGEWLLKRVVGLPGEELEMVFGTLLVNGVPLRENYVIAQGQLNVGKGELGKGKFAVFGDNRSLPMDQVVFAILPLDQIVGRVHRSLRFHARPGRGSNAGR
jgi:signal peptidase I